MQTLFINLDAATQRRAALEKNFRDLAPATWRLTRVQALEAERVVERGFHGSLRPSEKACLLSHERALSASLADPDPCLIVEDDALFGPNTFRQIDQLAVLRDEGIDLVYTSALIGDWVSIINQFLMRRTLSPKGEVCLLPLKGVVFSGADAYIVRNRAKARLLGLLRSLPSYDVPYDLLLQKWVRQGTLNAVVVFPFLTSLSPSADDSANGNAQIRWVAAANCFRRMMAYDADHYPGDIMAGLSRVDPSVYDAQTDNLAQVLRVFLARSNASGG